VPKLRYDSTGIQIHVGLGKAFSLPWQQVTSVQWQMGRRINRSRPYTPVVAIYYSTSLFGKPMTDVYYLDPTMDRGISRFMAAWDARHPQDMQSA